MFGVRKRVSARISTCSKAWAAACKLCWEAFCAWDCCTMADMPSMSTDICALVYHFRDGCAVNKKLMDPRKTLEWLLIVPLSCCGCSHSSDWCYWDAEAVSTSSKQYNKPSCKQGKQAREDCLMHTARVLLAQSSKTAADMIRMRNSVRSPQYSMSVKHRKLKSIVLRVVGCCRSPEHA